MKVRKRTRGGKSLNMKVERILGVVARGDDENYVTLSFELEYYETEFNITLTKNEALSLVKEILPKTKML